MIVFNRFFLTALILCTAITAAENAPSADATAKEFITAHNQWRRQVGVPDLSWSEKLAEQAQDYADILQRRGCVMQHSEADGYGENLYLAWRKPGPVQVTPTQVVNSWGSEKQYYDYADNRCDNPKASQGCGHYTQMVWNSTEHVGCGSASCNQGDSETEIWVCQYSPPGNYFGEKPY